MLLPMLLGASLCAASLGADPAETTPSVEAPSESIAEPADRVLTVGGAVATGAAAGLGSLVGLGVALSSYGFVDYFSRPGELQLLPKVGVAGLAVLAVGLTSFPVVGASLLGALLGAGASSRTGDAKAAGAGAVWAGLGALGGTTAGLIAAGLLGAAAGGAVVLFTVTIGQDSVAEVTPAVLADVGTDVAAMVGVGTGLFTITTGAALGSALLWADQAAPGGAE